MQEIITGFIMALDVVALYLLLPNVKQKFMLSLWTALLHMIFPFIGYSVGNFMFYILLQWSNLISSILLFSIGLHFILSVKKRQDISIPISILAVTSSLDTFSVSISFGMLNLGMYLFIISAGIWTFSLSYISLLLAKKRFPLKGGFLKWIAGISFIVISLYSLFSP